MNHDELLRAWQNYFKLDDWDINLVKISENEVMDCDKVCAEFVGVLPEHNIKTAQIFHTRDLKEDDIIHELLHIKYPSWSEDTVNGITGSFLSVIASEDLIKKADSWT